MESIRFDGFSDIYESSRPTLPRQMFEILKKYKSSIETIVDIGCGTGLSTKVCEEFADRVIGIDPSEDMLKQAKRKENDKIKFIQGYGENTTLSDSVADIVICAQSFHWMKKDETLNEVYRILKPNGVFVIIDANYPPIINKELEKLYFSIVRKAKKQEAFEEKILVNKEKHIDSIKNSNLFDYAREIFFSKTELYDKERFKNFILSQSTVQKCIKGNYGILKEDLENLDDRLESVFKGTSLEAIFSYEMRIGIK